jgi:hypothetical protein
MRVKPFEKLGRGSSKQAFTIQEDTAGEPDNFTIEEGSDVTKFCIVKYTNSIWWLPKSSYSKNFIKFLKDMTDPQFKRNFNNNLIRKDYEFNDKEIESCKNMYNNRKPQFECIAELKKMMELGELFAPKLRQIRIDIINARGAVEEYGIPFSPNEMDSKFEEIGNNNVFVSYLVERCDESVIKFVSKNGEKKPEVAAKMIEFIDSYIERQNELNCDIKSDNFCPRIVDGRVISIRLLDVDPKYCIKGYTPEFKQNAKVFMKYAFITHSVKWGQKIDEKRKIINFGNLGITQHEVDAAIRFFYKPEYMVYEFNPINMLYHYFVSLDPGNFVELPGWEIQIIEKTNYAGEKIKVKQFHNKLTNEKTYFLPYEYEFLSYDKLFLYFTENPDKIIELFKELNKEIGIVLLSGGGGGPSEAVAEPDEKEIIERYSEDTTENAPPHKPNEANKELGGGRRKRKSKKRKSNKRKRTRKV